ncbi:MAG: hypothetical protein IKB09_09620 [Oscillospiraceae bacterium]|nr:hypothetical protein [Oscillospiraceae bacterium]MBR6595187.1 hypothetical protein [Oscillospiraceae bacterium]
MGKYERTPAPQDELMDEELLALGVKFTDQTQLEKKLREIPVTAYNPTAEDVQIVKEKPGKIGRALINWSSLVVADALLMFMCLADKIELGYGLVFLAAASAILGGRASRARL